MSQIEQNTMFELLTAYGADTSEVIKKLPRLDDVVSVAEHKFIVVSVTAMSRQQSFLDWILGRKPWDVEIEYRREVQQ